jgi:hypothetical protein
LPAIIWLSAFTLLAGCWQQEYLQFQFGGAPVSQQALAQNPCSDPQFAALASGIIKVVHVFTNHENVSSHLTSFAF